MISHPDGEVTSAYDRHLTSDALIEAALKGMGFKLKHIFDHPDADEVEVQAALKGLRGNLLSGLS